MRLALSMGQWWSRLELGVSAISAFNEVHDSRDQMHECELRSINLNLTGTGRRLAALGSPQSVIKMNVDLLRLERIIKKQHPIYLLKPKILTFQQILLNLQ